MGETIQTGAAKTCPKCGICPGFEVLRSGGGYYYIGTMCNCGPYSRESGYCKTREEAEISLKNKTYGR